MKIFAGSASVALAKMVAEAFHQPLGRYTLGRFADGELCPKFQESLYGQDIVLIQATPPPADNLIELLLMLEAAQRAQAAQITVIMPYMGYSRQDHVQSSGEPLSAQLLVRLLATMELHALILCEVHADQVLGKLPCLVNIIGATQAFMPYMKRLASDDLVFVAPDQGAISRARQFAHRFGTELVILDKQRQHANGPTTMTLKNGHSSHLNGKRAVIVDDILDTGHTICGAAQLLSSLGASAVYGLCTHAVCSDGAYERLERSPITTVFVTDTLSKHLSNTKVKVCSVAPLLAEALQRLCCSRPGSTPIVADDSRS